MYKQVLVLKLVTKSSAVSCSFTIAMHVTSTGAWRHIFSMLY